jgi:hypothetical protein
MQSCRRPGRKGRSGVVGPACRLSDGGAHALFRQNGRRENRLGAGISSVQKRVLSELGQLIIR